MREGYKVLVAIDACGGEMSERTEAAAIEQTRETGALVTSVVSIATAALSPDFTTGRGEQMFQILQQPRLS